jgi:hypothetical protein
LFLLQSLACGTGAFGATAGARAGILPLNYFAFMKESE